jgi:hypothetical protein
VRERLGAKRNALLMSQGFGSWKNWWRQKAFSLKAFAAKPDECRLIFFNFNLPTAFLSDLCVMPPFLLLPRVQMTRIWLPLRGPAWMMAFREAADT